MSQLSIAMQKPLPNFLSCVCFQLLARTLLLKWRFGHDCCEDRYINSMAIEQQQNHENGDFPFLQCQSCCERLDITCNYPVITLLTHYTMHSMDESFQKDHQIATHHILPYSPMDAMKLSQTFEFNLSPDQLIFHHCPQLHSYTSRNVNFSNSYANHG